MSSVPHEHVQREYPPPWGGRQVYRTRILALLALLRRPIELDDLRRSPGLKHARDEELKRALGQLEEEGRVHRSATPVHYYLGDRLVERYITTWSLKGGVR